jgi:16S rRNA (guanine527-N7)-methyltransferase
MLRLDIIDRWLAANGMKTLTAGQVSQLSRFQERLLEVNRYMNLTAITDETEIAQKHFIDSFTVLPFLPAGARMIDVGTGAGFPGVPVKIARPDITVTLLDSLQKRILFLRETIEGLGLSGVECVHGRAEELINRARKEKNGILKCFDICTVRAVARLDKLAAYTLPLVKPGGLLLALKGPDVTLEIKTAAPSLLRHGGAVREIKTAEIAKGIVHTVVVIEKRRQ